MLKIIKEFMVHKEFSIMQNPEYWKNDENFSFAPIVDYVSKELPKLFTSEIRYGLYNLPNYKYIREYMDLIAIDVKAGFYLGLTDEEVDEKNINFSNDFPFGTHNIEDYLSSYLKVTYYYKLYPEKRITVYYVFRTSGYYSVLDFISEVGTGRLVSVKNTKKYYTLLSYLLVNSIEIKTPEDFNELDIVVQCPFWHVSNKDMHRIGLMEVSNLLKEERDAKRLNKLARHREDILRGPLESILNVTEKVLHEVLSKEANSQIDTKKKADKEKAEMVEKEYQEKLRREKEANMRRLQQHSDWNL